MRQGNGTELLGMNDPRSATIGVIYVSPNDDRKSVLAAILTQEKLGRKDIVIDLPKSNNAFQSAQDFKDLEKDVARKLQAKIIFIATDDAGEYASQRQFAVFPTLDSYTQSLDTNTVDDKKGVPERRLPFFGRKSKPLNQGLAGGVVGGAAAGALLGAGQGASGVGGQGGSSGAAQSNLDEQDDQSVAQISPRRGAAPAPLASTIDDDDAIDDAPSVPVRHGSGAAGATGAGVAGGFLLSDTLRRGQADPNLDAAGPTPLRSAATSPNTPAVSAQAGQANQANQAAQGSPATPAADAAGGEAGGDPGIIDLRPVPRGAGRSTVDLKGNAAAAAARPVEPPAPRGAGRRRNGGALIGGLGLGAAAAASAAAASAAASGSANAAGAAAGAGAARPAGGGQPPQRSTPPGRGRRGNTPPRRGRALLLLLLLLLLTALISGFVYASINPSSFQNMIGRPISNLVPAVLQANPTTVTIIPDSKEVQDSYVMQAVASQANADQLQVGMRSLNIAPDAQSKTVTGTGRAQTQAVAATGTLTFFNGSTQSFTVGANNGIPGPNGVRYVPDTAVTIPGANPPTEGQATVRAHALVGGTNGNLDAGTLKGQCCAAGNFITVVNGAFTGGVDPKNYTFVQQDDVNAVATPLEAALSQQASTQFKQQLKPNEKLVSDPTCNSNVQVPPGSVGDQGHAIATTTITVTAKCTGVAYDRGSAQAIAKDRLQKKANIDPGQGYTLIGNIITDVTISKVNQDSISLLVNARGIWAYQFDAGQQQALARQLAGKKVSDARTILAGQHGINNAKIDTRGDTLPTDPAQITFTIQKVPGENASGNEGGNNANPNGTPTPVSGKGIVPIDSGKDKRA